MIVLDLSTAPCTSTHSSRNQIPDLPEYLESTVKKYGDFQDDCLSGLRNFRYLRVQNEKMTHRKHFVKKSEE